MIDADRLADALRAKVEALQAELLATVEANLSGDILQERSGALKASIVALLEMRDTIATATIASAGVPYAAIQEHGGVTAPHAIVPVKARALVLAGGGFARRVAHPGSVLPARRYLAGALEEFAPEIAVELKQAVRGTLGST